LSTVFVVVIVVPLGRLTVRVFSRWTERDFELFEASVTALS
jgi:hypothetical protein